MKTFITILITATLAIGGTWLLRGRMSPNPATSSGTAEREPIFYQSAMHPWIKSDKPGRCTICGMELTPVYAGEKGFDATGGGNTVALTQTQIQVLHVQTDEAKVQPLVHTLQVAGMVDDDATRHRIISAYVDGRVDKLHVNYMGAEVEGGQPLVDYYSPNLLQAEREYRQLTGDLKKNTALRLRQMGLTREQIEAVADKSADSLNSQILSPIGGTVVGQSVYEGQYVTAGEKLFELADFSTMWFMFRAYEQDLPWIKIGQTVTVTTPSLPGKSFEGKITFIDPNFEESTRSTKVRVELPNPKVDGRRELLHKLYADGAVKVDAPPVLTVPRSSIIQTGPEAVVYIDQNGGAYAQTPVKLGRRGDKLVEILSGLKAGDKVVTNGNLLIDGQAEMNRAFMSPATEQMPVVMTEALTTPQREAIQNFIKVADAMAAALSADDLAAFNKASEPAMSTTASLTESLANISGTKESLAALSNARHFHGFVDLKPARAAFHKFIMAATSVLEPMRHATGFPELQVWECPMVDRAVPGAPKKGRWIQTNGRPGNNPFFGAAMSECGKEIKP
ncbi:efflux RND transporter periplasmic adaptor subunit [Luteolibacter yonseiensis]|uniref:Efflux RND transporter periplasmic adaptor subunit n=1 Tax=Luteolibacter yonseiensis TaxID=1144680 RepID=A0A934R2V8_9BACT|nr:efflux RND transporter periplasmic adaptor subunit [Luteolibacter yonseiensis]MBK1817383.1 efflux RND transporter periplasmic adaptor subunit [Luteolibacter yonseiensis]